MCIISKRLKLETIKKSDVENYCRLYNNSNVMKYLGGAKGKVVSEEITKISNPDLNLYQVLIISSKQNNNFIGVSGVLNCKNKIDNQVISREIYYILAESEWGKGYGSEIAPSILKYAEDLYPKASVIAKVNPDNHHSIKILQKCGMVQIANVESKDFDNGFFQFINPK